MKYGKRGAIGLNREHGASTLVAAIAISRSVQGIAGQCQRRRRTNPVRQVEGVEAMQNREACSIGVHGKDRAGPKRATFEGCAVQSVPGEYQARHRHTSIAVRVKAQILIKSRRRKTMKRPEI